MRHALICAAATAALWIAIAGARGSRAPALAEAVPAATFDVARARAHIEQLAGTIGRRPTGSAANARARAYLVGELTSFGFAVRLQETDAVDPRNGITARVANIIATRTGRRDDAIALAAHYDSIPDGPGALDNALGVASVVESARALTATGGLSHTLIVALTDGEEFGLMGARALVGDDEVRRRVRAWINFDATGADGPSLMFQTTGGDALAAWARGAPSPRGASWAMEIYRRLPNDTDFSIYKTLGVPGLNFATVKDAYGYHTDRDLPGRVTDAVIRHEGTNTVGVVRALDNTALRPDAAVPAYFDVAGRWAFVVPDGVDRLVADFALVAGGTAWLSALALLWRRDRPARVVVTALWWVVAAAAASGAALAVVPVLRWLRPERQPWYAHPSPLIALLVSISVAALGATMVVATRVPVRARAAFSPASVWVVALPVWISLAIALNRTAPQTAFLFTLPLLALCIPIALPLAGSTKWIVGAVLGLMVVVLLWWPGLALLVRFVVTLFGWLPIATPAWVYAVFVIGAGLMIGPPLLALGLALPSVIRRGRLRALAGGAVAIAAVTSAVFAAIRPAYTDGRPVRRSVRYLQDQASGRAWWEIAANEPGGEFAAGSPPASAWRQTMERVPATMPIGRLPGPFRMIADTAPMIDESPIDVTVSEAPGDAGTRRATIAIVPRENLAVRLTLPSGIAPIDTSVAGAMIDGVWTATYIAVPRSGLTVRLTLPDRGAARGVQIAAITDHLPGAPLDERLPGWLKTDTTAWTARSWYVIKRPEAGAPAGAASARPIAPPGRSR